MKIPRKLNVEGDPSSRPQSKYVIIEIFASIAMNFKLILMIFSEYLNHFSLDTHTHTHTHARTHTHAHTHTHTHTHTNNTKILGEKVSFINIFFILQIFLYYHLSFILKFSNLIMYHFWRKA